jgi:hypothetical protein
MSVSIPTKLNIRMVVGLVVVIFILGCCLGRFIVKRSNLNENFIAGIPVCADCSKAAPQCTCPQAGSAKTASRLVCPPCKMPDLSKYVLKSSIPSPQRCPDLSNYMLKTECPPVPDLSKYVLKSSIPKQQPLIIDNSSCTKDAGECPPCPRARCPEVKCPPPTVCPAPAPCARQVCPQPKVHCKAESSEASTVRPYLAPLSFSGFGMGM